MVFSKCNKKVTRHSETKADENSERERTAKITDQRREKKETESDTRHSLLWIQRYHLETFYICISWKTKEESLRKRTSPQRKTKEPSNRRPKGSDRKWHAFRENREVWSARLTSAETCGAMAGSRRLSRRFRVRDIHKHQSAFPPDWKKSVLTKPLQNTSNMNMILFYI